MRITQTTVALLAATGFAAPLSGQQAMHGHDATPARTMSCGMGDMMNMMGMMRGMHGDNAVMDGGMMGEGMTMMPAGRVTMDAMRFMPGRVLPISDSLGLSQDQVSQIEALRPAGGMMMHGQADSAADAALEQAFNAERPDPGAVRQAAERALQQHMRVQAGHIAAAAAVRGILTPEQRERVTAMMQCPMSGMGMQGGTHQRGMMGR